MTFCCYHVSHIIIHGIDLDWCLVQLVDSCWYNLISKERLYIGLYVMDVLWNKAVHKVNNQARKLFHQKFHLGLQLQHKVELSKGAIFSLATLFECDFYV